MEVPPLPDFVVLLPCSSVPQTPDVEVTTAVVLLFALSKLLFFETVAGSVEHHTMYSEHSYKFGKKPKLVLVLCEWKRAKTYIRSFTVIVFQFCCASCWQAALFIRGKQNVLMLSKMSGKVQILSVHVQSTCSFWKLSNWIESFYMISFVCYTDKKGQWKTRSTLFGRLTTMGLKSGRRVWFSKMTLNRRYVKSRTSSGLLIFLKICNMNPFLVFHTRYCRHN